MAMFLSLLPCSDCPTTMKECGGCAQFFIWLNVAVVHQGRTKGFEGSEGILNTTSNGSWSVAGFVREYYHVERSNAARIWRETAKGQTVGEVTYTGKKPCHGPTSVFTLHHNELEMLEAEFHEHVVLTEERKAERKAQSRWTPYPQQKELTVEELRGPLGSQLKVADRSLYEVLAARECVEAG